MYTLLPRYAMTICLSLLLLFGHSVSAEKIVLKDHTKTALEVVKNTPEQLILLSSLSEIQVLKVGTDAGTFAQIAIPGYSFTEQVGDPQLPVLRRLIDVPFHSSLRIEVVGYTTEEYSLEELGILFPIIPDQPPHPKSSVSPAAFSYNATVYQQDAFWGQDLVTVDVLGVLRGVQIGLVTISPFEYNPVKQILRVYHDIKVRIFFDDADLVKTQRMRSLMDDPFFRGICARLLNNRPDIPRDTITRSPVKYVIVSDPVFQPQLQPFIEWKTKKGFTVVEAYTDDPQVGTTTLSIKAYLQSLYEAHTPADPAPSFVLFVGDVGQIPAWNLSGESDLKYCEYTGDYFPEVYYGRFSANTPAQLQPQIDKTLLYEQYVMPDPSYLGEVVMIGGMDGNFGANWANGQINYGTENYFNELHGILSHTYLYPSSGSQSGQIIQNISDGVAFANYTAHGSPGGWADPSFVISDIATLQNQDEYGLLIGNACSTNEFATSECFGEALLRAANKGAIGYIGGSNSTYWDEDYYWGVGVGPITQDPPSYEETTLGAYDRMFHDHGEPVEDWYTTQDQMIFAGNLAVTEGAPGSAQYYWDIYCLMGDPSLMPYLGVPEPLAASYDPLMPLASSVFQVETEPYAYVAISKDGVLHGACFADENGAAQVSLIPITVPGMADIVITTQNRQPFTGEVVVASPEGPYVLLDGFQINDISGNNNQQADCGEDILLDLTLKNVGNSMAANLFATLTCSDPYATVIDGDQVWPDIPSDSSSFQQEAFLVHVHDSIPDLHSLACTLEITDGSDTWSSNFHFKLHAPVLEIGAFAISDGTFGNGNGRLDAGEIADITFMIYNTGHSQTGSILITLQSMSEFIIMNNSEVFLESLPAGEGGTATFTITVDPSAPTGNVGELLVIAASEPYITEKTCSVKIGTIIEDFETGTFEAFDWQFSGNSEWMIWEGGYSGDYCARSGAIPNQAATELKITLDVLADDSISFFRKVSSEADYDFLKFYIDGNLQDQWSGSHDWAKATFPVNQGQHTFRWIYEKDYYVTAGSDCAWIDLIEFPAMEMAPGPFALHTYSHPPEICHGATTMLFAIPSGGIGSYTYSWEPAGSLSDPTVFNPVAFPYESTVYTVVVTSGQDTLSAEVAVTILPAPAPPVISQVGEELVSGEPQGNQWYFWGTPIPGANGQTYLPAGTGEYTATVTSEAGCESGHSNPIYYIYTTVGDLYDKPLLEIYPNPFRESVQIKYTLQEASFVQLMLYSASGEKVRVLVDEPMRTHGSFTYYLSAAGLEPGIYYCRFESSGRIEVRKLILTK